ncbi:unnamed protein product, partial [Polarella glacialis]
DAERRAKQVAFDVAKDAERRTRLAAEASKGYAERGVSQVRSVVEQQRSGGPSSSSSARLPVSKSFLQRPAPGTTNSSATSVQIRVCSWNLQGRCIDREDDMRPWLLPDGKGADVLVIGVQELVELGPMSMFLGTDGDEERQTLLEKRVESVLATTGGRYVKMCSFGMVGLALLTYVRESLDPHVGEVFIDRVKTGMEGMGGNK